jgi:hypothetical protein
MFFCLRFIIYGFRYDGSLCYLPMFAIVLHSFHSYLFCTCCHWIIIQGPPRVDWYFMTCLRYSVYRKHVTLENTFCLFNVLARPNSCISNLTLEYIFCLLSVLTRPNSCISNFDTEPPQEFCYRFSQKINILFQIHNICNI